MSDAYVIIGIIVFVLIVTALVSRKLLSPAIRMQKTGEGERTKFIIDTSKMGYEYYEAKINEWLDYNKFSGYNKNKNARYLKYYIDELILRFGFNYYRKDNLLIIEAWLVVFGNENPLVEKLYTYQDGDVDMVKGLTGNKFAADSGVPIAVNQQAKKLYSEFLSSLIDMPKEIKDENIVTLKDNIDYTKIRNQKIEKKKTFMVICFLLIVSILLSAIIILPKVLNKPKPLENDRDEALAIIRSKYPDFVLDKTSNSVSEVKVDGKTKYVISYIFYGTIDNDEYNNYKVTIFMSNSSYSNYTCIDDDCKWTWQMVKSEK